MFVLVLVLVLVGDYLPLLEKIEQRYPDGIERKVTRGGSTEFVAYEVRD